jgi:hypothetical protein
MTREELESVIWRQMRLLTRQNPQVRQSAMETVLQAADDYAATVGGITAERRRALDVVLPPGVRLRTVHYQVTCPQFHDECKYPPVSCNTVCWIKRDVLATTVAADVTCRRCQGGRLYLRALALAQLAVTS